MSATPRSSASSRWSHSASPIRAFSTTVRSSPARSSGMVGTAMPPAFITPRMAAANSGVFGGAQQHAIAGDHPERPGQHGGDPVHAIGGLGVAPGLGGGEQAAPRAAALGDVAIEQLGHGIEPLGIGKPGIQQVRPLLARGQVVAREAVERHRSKPPGR